MRQSWPKVVLINLLVLVLILAPLEIATRVLAPEHVNVHFSDSVTRGRPIFKHHAWGHRVGRTQVDDPLGRRGDEYRILFLGDSVTFGYGVDYEAAYHEIAGGLLREAGCRVMVHGVGMYWSDLDKLLASSFRPFIESGFDANLVIYQFNVNDLDLPQPPPPPSWKTTLLNDLQRLRIAYLNQSAFLTAVQSMTTRMYQRSLKQALRSSLRYSPASDPEVYEQQWRVMEESLIAARDLFARHGAAFAILLIPEDYRLSAAPIDNGFQIDLAGITTWPDERMRALAGRIGIPVYDSLPALRQYRAAHPDAPLYFPNDENHPNEVGHRIVGTAVAKELRGQLAACRPPSSAAPLITELR